MGFTKGAGYKLPALDRGAGFVGENNTMADSWKRQKTSASIYAVCAKYLFRRKKKSKGEPEEGGIRRSH